MNYWEGFRNTNSDILINIIILITLNFSFVKNSDRFVPENRHLISLVLEHLL